MTRVQRNTDGALGYAWQRSAPTSIRELIVDNMIPIGCSIGDYVIALDDGSWDALGDADFATAYTAVPA